MKRWHEQLSTSSSSSSSGYRTINNNNNVLLLLQQGQGSPTPSSPFYSHCSGGCCKRIHGCNCDISNNRHDGVILNNKKITCSCCCDPNQMIHPNHPNHNHQHNHQNSNRTCSFDCQSLGSSLKRVRLSQSPGELRLERDLLYLVTHDGWMKINDRTWILSGSDSTCQRSDAQLERSDVDPLRLVLTCKYYTIKCVIQLPRRYPHSPPSVSRIIYTNNDCSDVCNSNNSISSPLSSSSLPSISATSVVGLKDYDGSTNSSCNSFPTLKRKSSLVEMISSKNNNIAAASTTTCNNNSNNKVLSPPVTKLEQIIVSIAPPIPSCIVDDDISNNSNTAFDPSSSTNSASSSSSSSSSSLSSDTTTASTLPIQETMDCSPLIEENKNNHHGLTRTTTMTTPPLTTTPRTAIYNEWTPIKRLGDLLIFILHLVHNQ